MALEDFGDEFILLEKIRIRTPEGGVGYTWKDGMAFTVYMYKNAGAEMRIAEQLGATSTFEGNVDIDFPLVYNDYFRDPNTGATYRVTSDPNEQKAPKLASESLRVKHFTAEKKVPPT